MGPKMLPQVSTRNAFEERTVSWMTPTTAVGTVLGRGAARCEGGAPGGMDEEYVQMRWLVGQATTQELAVCLDDPHEATAYLTPLRAQVAMPFVRHEVGKRVWRLWASQ